MSDFTQRSPKNAILTSFSRGPQKVILPGRTAPKVIRKEKIKYVPILQHGNNLVSRVKNLREENKAPFPNKDYTIVAETTVDSSDSDF